MSLQTIAPEILLETRGGESHRISQNNSVPHNNWLKLEGPGFSSLRHRGPTTTYLSLGDKRRYYQVCKQLNILPLSARFDYKDVLFFHNVFYGLSVVEFPPYLKRFTGSRLRRSHLDDLCFVSLIRPPPPRAPENFTSNQNGCKGQSHHIILLL